ncbi:MAG: DUF4249 domain-containing protein [Bacteroidales bacterium]
MKKRLPGNRFLIMALLMLMNLSCTEIIDIELDTTYQRLVVQGSITNDSVFHQVELSLSGDYFSNQPSPRVSNALVKLEFNDVILQMMEHDSIPGLYLTPYAFRGVIGTTYSLSIDQVDVDNDGESESYHAASTMPGGVRLDSISLNYFSSYYGSGYQVYMFALDPPSRDWYGLKYWKNSDLLTDTLIKYSVQSDDFYNGKYLFYGIPIGYYSDEEPREQLQPGDIVTLELNSIERAYYDFVGDAQLEIWGNNPLFSGPPANIRSNVDNGAMGVFTAYSIQRASAVVSE